MKNLLTIATLAALTASTQAETLELRIVSDTGASEIMVNTSGVWVDMEIQARFVDDDTDGLGMWSTMLTESGSLDFTMSSTDGFGSNVEINTSGLRFSLIECLVIVSIIDVVSTGWTTLDTGQAYVEGVPGETIELSLADAYATVVDDLGGGDYDASAADISIVGGPLTIRMVSLLTAADSIGYVDSNGTWAGGDIAYPIEINTAIGTSGLSESRSFSHNGDDLWVRMTFEDDVDASSISFMVTPDAGTNATLTQGPENNIVDFTWDGRPLLDLTTNGLGPQYAYRVELGGAAGGEFEIAYIWGDVDCSGSNTGSDISIIGNSANWQKSVDVAATPRADVNRDGTINFSDTAVIANSANWLKPYPKQDGHEAVTCP